MTKAHGFLALLAGAVLTASAHAQSCPDPTDTFYKNDILADVPVGPLPIAIVPGLCEGEGAASVFTMIGNAPQTISQVVCPYTSPTGTGLSALVNVQIFDNVTFDGNGVPDMSNLVFDLVSATGNEMQVFEGGLNTFDMTPYNVSVSGPKFAVAFIMNFNPNGSCGGGYSSNFFTDNTSCPVQSSLIQIQGQGWVDSSLANVSGFPLCPIFYAGDWVIRCCTDLTPSPTIVHSCIQTSQHYAGGIVDLLASHTNTTQGAGLQLEAQGGPPGEFGFFLISPNSGSVTPLFNGVLCLGAPLGRFNSNVANNQGNPDLNSLGQFDGAGVLQNLSGTSAFGSGFTLPLALPMTPPGQTLTPGSTWSVQLWYRDLVGAPGPLTPSANFSNVLTLTMP
tara:strand:+ start:5300 stop:6475 length:1176 start_codon:yes stop_codon:yes gene_type:complete